MTNEERRGLLSDVDADYLKVAADAGKLLRDINRDGSLDPAIRKKAILLLAKFSKVDEAIDEIDGLLKMIEGEGEGVGPKGEPLAESADIDDISISVFVTLPEKKLIDSEYVSRTLKYALDAGDLKEDGEFAELTGREAMSAVRELDNALPLYGGKDATILGNLRDAIAEELEKSGVFAVDDGKRTLFRDASGNEVGFSTEGADSYVDYIDW